MHAYLKIFKLWNDASLLLKFLSYDAFDDSLFFLLPYAKYGMDLCK